MPASLNSCRPGQSSIVDDAFATKANFLRWNPGAKAWKGKQAHKHMKWTPLANGSMKITVDGPSTEGLSDRKCTARLKGKGKGNYRPGLRKSSSSLLSDWSRNPCPNRNFGLLGEKL
ncbi:uncharacterized protein J3R85_015336 [Psidium guajava]|nr:uncharacterized protein J3R85_015336 [Psidium guajava]